MTVHLVTFSDESMGRSARLCMGSATKNGVDYAGYWPWTAKYCRRGKWFDAGLKGTQFYRDNQTLLDQPRGLGYWAWKPFVIQEAMALRGVGDIVVYSDAGIEFIAPVPHIINRMDQDVFLFGNNWQHSHWCKRDVVDAIWPWTNARDVDGNELSWERFGKQCQASVIFFRVSDYTRTLIAEWLKWCLFEGGRLIDDSPSHAPNHPEFREHRHDQAILTTMAYRDGLTLHYWPASYNDGAFVYEKLSEYAGDNYPILFNHHRRRNHEWPMEDLTGGGNHAFYVGRGSS